MILYLTTPFGRPQTVIIIVRDEVCLPDLPSINKGNKGNIRSDGKMSIWVYGSIPKPHLRSLSTLATASCLFFPVCWSQYRALFCRDGHGPGLWRPLGHGAEAVDPPLAVVVPQGRLYK